ncbi:MAG: hypothetical protein A4S09_02950 [Proteobacteria bacterium SG_bin7]|nr:MAG: hypothetical protein A4S09_02950 [Proteobacteria bacterium SG_bin7]
MLKLLLNFSLTIHALVAKAEEIGAAATPESEVLQADETENLPPVLGPRLPVDYQFLKAPRGKENAKDVDFNFLKSGGKLLPAKFVYEVNEKGTRIGPILIRPQNLNLKYRTNGGKRNLIFEFPGHFPDHGRLQIFQAADNKLLWQRDFDKWDLGERLKKLNVKSKTNMGKKHFFRWTEEKVDEDQFNFIKNSKGLKYCVAYEGEGFQHNLCTGIIAASTGETRFKATSEENAEIVVTINGKSERPNGVVVVGLDGDTIKFKASLPDGSTVEIFTKPITFEILDAIRTPEKELLIRARGATPFEENIKFLEDGSWRHIVKKFHLYVSGAGEIPFYQELFINQQLPSSEEKIKISKRSFLNTYNSDTMIYGFTPNTAKIETVDGSANKYENQYFTWYVDKLQKGQVSKPNIGVGYGSRNYQGSVDVYRGYQLEIGARISGVAVVQTKDLLLISDLVLNYWSETLFGSKNYWFGQQRWGLKAKYLKSITKMDLLESFSSTHFDIAYRLIPGIWERDATVGLLVDYQSVNVNTDTVAMVGGGVFWAQSMPKFIDNIFNIIPFFRYPKWVDMEFMYYFSSLNPSYVLGANFLYNFHGKMLVTPRFYFEGGGSMRQINFGRADGSLSPLSASFLQGTLGIGYNF